MQPGETRCGNAINLTIGQPVFSPITFFFLLMCNDFATRWFRAITNRRKYTETWHCDFVCPLTMGTQVCVFCDITKGCGLISQVFSTH